MLIIWKLNTVQKTSEKGHLTNSGGDAVTKQRQAWKNRGRVE